MKRLRNLIHCLFNGAPNLSSVEWKDSWIKVGHEDGSGCDISTSEEGHETTESEDSASGSRFETRIFRSRSRIDKSRSIQSDGHRYNRADKMTVSPHCHELSNYVYTTVCSYTPFSNFRINYVIKNHVTPLTMPLKCRKHAIDSSSRWGLVMILNNTVIAFWFPQKSWETSSVC
jgi:hypothetical protein